MSVLVGVVRTRAPVVLLLLLLSTVSCSALSDGQTHALKLVFLPFMGGNSPSMDLMGVAAALQARGHSVTVVVTASGLAFAKRSAARHSSNTTAEAMQYVELTMQQPDFVENQIGNLMKVGQHPGKFSSLMMLVGIQNMLAQPCAALLQDGNAMQVLKTLHADAIMGVAIPVPHSDSCGCVLSHVLGGVPFIDINGHPMIDAPVTVPQFGAGISPAQLSTVIGFAKNVAAYVMRNLVPMLVMDYGPNPWVDLRTSAGLPRAASGCPLTNMLVRMRGQQPQRCHALLEVFLSTFLIEPPRPLAAHQKLVGPGTPRPPQPIQPWHVAEFVEGASQGLVLVAFGSTIQTIVMNRDDILQLARGFAALAPARVLWAMSERGLPSGMRVDDLQLGPNTMLTPWVDYNDVLGHKHTRAFVSHCGVHSINEAAFHGVPVVAVPIQFEQAEHALRLVNRGVGVVSHEAPAYRKAKSDPTHYTADGIRLLVQEVMTNASYAQNTQGVAASMQRYAARRQPYKRAADEVELSILTAHVRASAAAAAAAAGRPKATNAGAAQRQQPGKTEEL